ncbi:MAG: DUF6115 domain-containing protein [Lachnospiraceae bacterium]
MSPVEIIFVILGISLLIISCFVTGRNEETEAASTQPSSLEITKEQKQKLEEEVNHILEDRTEQLIVKTDDYLSKISNEKIMAVNDFTAQIIEKIDSNHKEVVFLYDMLNQKEAEIKATVQDLETEKKGLKEAVEDVAQLTKQLNATIKRSETKKTVSAPEGHAVTASATGIEGENAKRASEKSQTKKTPVKPKAKREMKEKEIPASRLPGLLKAEEQMELPEMMQTDNKNEEILRLYRQGKNVLEISKELGLGQGEVKLVIGLYGPA